MTDTTTPEGPWNDSQAEAAMVAAAVRSGADWGYALFLTIADAFAPDARAGAQEWAVELSGTTTLALIEDTERAADFLKLDAEKRRQLIADRVGACRGRVMELAARVAPGGSV